MALEFKRILKDWFKPGIEYGLIATLLSLIVGFLKLPLVNVTFSAIDINVRNQLVVGGSTNLGAKWLGFLSGIVGFDMPTIVVTLVSGLLVMYLGRIVYTWLPNAKTPVGRLTTVLVVGSLLSGFLASWVFTLPAFGVIAGLVIYSVVISLIMWGLSTKFPGLRIPE